MPGSNPYTLINNTVADADEVMANFDFLLGLVDGLPDGTLLNGRLSVSVSSNNLTVSLITDAGTTPSVTNQAYIKIQGIWHTINSALSVTKNAATSWCNAGSAELATKEIDYFPYIILRTDVGAPATNGGLDLSFSRIPFGNVYSDFSSTTTNEKHLACGTAGTPTATDNVVLIGRFAATLSAAAGYTWSVPTFTSVNLKHKPIYETRTLFWTPVYTGFSISPSNQQPYKVIFDKLFCYIDDQGTSNSATFNFTIPLSPRALLAGSQNYIIKIIDNSSHPTSVGLLGINVGGSSSNTVKVGINLSTAAANAYGGFTTSNAKGTEGEFFCFLN